MIPHACFLKYPKSCTVVTVPWWRRVERQIMRGIVASIGYKTSHQHLLYNMIISWHVVQFFSLDQWTLGSNISNKRRNCRKKVCTAPTFSAACLVPCLCWGMSANIGKDAGGKTIMPTWTSWTIIESWHLRKEFGDDVGWNPHIWSSSIYWVLLCTAASGYISAFCGITHHIDFFRPSTGAQGCWLPLSGARLYRKGLGPAPTFQQIGACRVGPRPCSRRVFPGR